MSLPWCKFFDLHPETHWHDKATCGRPVLNETAGERKWPGAGSRALEFAASGRGDGVKQALMT